MAYLKVCIECTPMGTWTAAETALRLAAAAAAPAGSLGAELANIPTVQAPRFSFRTVTSQPDLAAPLSVTVMTPVRIFLTNPYKTVHLRD